MAFEHVGMPCFVGEDSLFLLSLTVSCFARATSARGLCCVFETGSGIEVCLGLSGGKGLRTVGRLHPGTKLWNVSQQ